jgi:hypothetical protein
MARIHDPVIKLDLADSDFCAKAKNGRRTRELNRRCAEPDGAGLADDKSGCFVGDRDSARARTIPNPARELISEAVRAIANPGLLEIGPENIGPHCCHRFGVNEHGEICMPARLVRIKAPACYPSVWRQTIKISAQGRLGRRTLGLGDGSRSGPLNRYRFANRRAGAEIAERDGSARSGSNQRRIQLVSKCVFPVPDSGSL